MSERVEVSAVAALARGGTPTGWSFTQREVRQDDVVIEVLFCGICHTDLHMMGPWGALFPVVPGHEFIGRVREVGSAVTRHAAGDTVAVSVIVGSCGQCPPCRAGLETYCITGATPTYGAPDPVDGTPTRGGWAEQVVVDERFVYPVPAGLDLAGAAPLLCAGITTFAPLRHWRVDSDSTVGVVGIGGLGHLGVRFARALGADDVVLSTDADDMARQAHRMDLILDTVAVDHAIEPYLKALRLDGTYCSLGLPPAPLQTSAMTLALGRRSIAGSGAGGSAEINDMLAFSARHGITAEIELVSPDDVPVAVERLARNDVRFRFVLDRTGPSSHSSLSAAF